MKTYLVTISSHSEGIKRFLESAKILEDRVEHLAIQFMPYTEMKTHAAYDQPYPGNFRRFEYVPKLLDKDGYIIFTDTDDVIFQKPFPYFGYDMFLAPENITHDQTIWKDVINKVPEFEPLRYKEVYNGGMFIMKVPVFYSYLNFMKHFKVKKNSDFFDQLYFNMFINLHPEYSKVIDLSILCPLYSNFDKGLCFKKDGIWKTIEGKIISAVHSNGIKNRL